MNLSARASRIKAVVLDIDGVLTDGRIGYGPEAGEIKFFHVRDGHGIKLLRRAGIRVGFLSGRQCEANRRRAEELGVDFAYQGEKDKLSAFTRLLAEQGLQADECLCMGDDVVDLPLLRHAGLGVAVADAVPDVRGAAHLVTALPGGHGAVREVAEWLLKEQGRWPELMQRYQES